MQAGAQASAPTEADVIIVNTCSVTSAADQGARQIIRKMARENPSARIVVTGCYATRRPDELAALPGVLQVIPNDLKERLTEQISLSTAERFGAGEGACGAALEPGTAGRTAYTLRVQTGCDQTCSYCIIPSTRGRGKSRPLADVLAEIERAAAATFKEIVITGVHLGSYGRDFGDGTTLVTLMEAVERAAEGLRVRVSSLEPMDCTQPVVDLATRSSVFAPHFHLPLQHASDRMLTAMRRPYTIAFYRRLVDGIRQRMAHASIGSDLIVGFPGETDGDFAELEQYLATSPLTHVHVFPYSDRPGTDAANLPNKVHGGVVRDRASRLRAISRDLTARFHASQHGTVRPALTIDDGTTAVTDNYLKLKIGEGRPRNEWLSVRVIAHAGELRGQPVPPL